MTGYLFGMVKICGLWIEVGGERSVGHGQPGQPGQPVLVRVV